MYLSFYFTSLLCKRIASFWYIDNKLVIKKIISDKIEIRTYCYIILLDITEKQFDNSHQKL